MRKHGRVFVQVLRCGVLDCTSEERLESSRPRLPSGWQELADGRLVCPAHELELVPSVKCCRTGAAQDMEPLEDGTDGAANDDAGA